MKKFYTIALSALVAFSAAAELKLSSNSANLAPVAVFDANSTVSERNVTPITVSRPKVKAPAAKAASFSKVSDLAGTWTLSYYSFINGEGWQTRDVTVNAISNNQIEIVGFFSTIPVVADVNILMGTVSIPKQYMFTNTLYNKDVYFYAEDLETEEVKDTPAVGTIDGSTISFSTSDVLCVGIEGLGYFFCGANVEMTKPDESYSVEIVMDDCANDDFFEFSVNAGASVTNLKYYLLPGMFPATSDYLNVIATVAYPLPATTGLTIDGSTFARGAYTIYVIAVDNDGNVVGGTNNIFYIYADDFQNWKTLPGKVTYSEDIINSLYNNFSVADYQLDIQENITTPGYYRLVNPYGEAYPKAANNQHATSHNHNHYLYINASDPDKVVVEFSPLAFSLGDGSMYVNSMVNYLKDNDAEESEYAVYYGKYDENTRTITVPEKGLITGESRYEYGKPGYANYNGLFKVVLPDMAGVDGIAADDNAEAEYFNLQGVRISNPAAGQLVIKRQGSVVTKTIVR